MLFCEDIEAIFAKAELEKMPLVDPDRAKPYGSWTQTKELPVLPLSPEKEGVAHSCMQKIAEQVRARSYVRFYLQVVQYLHIVLWTESSSLLSMFHMSID